VSSNHRTDPPPASNPAPGLAAPPQPRPGCNAPDGGQNPKPKPPIKLTRNLLKARAAIKPTAPPVPGCDGEGGDIEGKAEAEVVPSVKSTPGLPEHAPVESTPTHDRARPQVAIRRPPSCARKGGGPSNPVEGSGEIGSLLARMAAEEAEQKARLGITSPNSLLGRGVSPCLPNWEVVGRSRPPYPSAAGAQDPGPSRPEYTTKAARALAASGDKKVRSGFLEQFKSLGALQNTEKRMFRESRDSLVLHVVRFAGVRRLARPILKPEHYSLPDEVPHQVILRHVYRLVDSGAGLTHRFQRWPAL